MVAQLRPVLVLWTPSEPDWLRLLQPRCYLRPGALAVATPPGSSPAALPRQEPSQVIEWASRLLRVAVVAPSMVAITTPEPPEVAEIDSVAPCAESVTVR